VEDKSLLSYDLKFIVGLRERIPLQGNGPRNFVADGDNIYIPTYFSDILNVVSLTTPANITTSALVVGREESDVDRGEKYFNDATYCFQNWQSCNGCHPGDGRTDGLNWDNLNDGTGNPKNCKSMLVAHYTSPSMISGIRENAERAVRAGFKYIQFNEVGENIATCVDAYLKSLKPVPSPYLVDGGLSEKAQRGMKVFHKYGCVACHNGEYYTDCKMHVIGGDVEFENGWDTPTLVEVWRTAPYLFDGRAATMDEVFSVYRHGLSKKSKITIEEIEDLVEYVNSL
jgi:cytochrome c peroxidase